jgi:hypothetical protein
MFGQDTEPFLKRFAEMTDIGMSHQPGSLADIGFGFIKNPFSLLHPVLPEIVKYTFPVCLPESGLELCRVQFCLSAKTVQGWWGLQVIDQQSSGLRDFLFFRHVQQLSVRLSTLPVEKLIILIHKPGRIHISW